MALPELVQDGDREAEGEASDDRRERRVRHAPAEQVGGPCGYRGAKQRQDVERGDRPEPQGDRRQEQARDRGGGGPREVDAAGCPDELRVQRVQVMGERVRPPPQRPDEDGGVHREPGDEPAAEVVHDLGPEER